MTNPTQLAALEQDIKRDLPTDGTVTILFCDMVDYAGMTERLGDQASRAVLREHHRMVRDAIARHGGREISVQGDGFMVAFGGVARALRCAIDIQRAVAAYVPPTMASPSRCTSACTPVTPWTRATTTSGTRSLWPAGWPTLPAPGEVLVSSLSEQLVQGSGEFTFEDPPRGDTQGDGSAAAVGHPRLGR